MHFVFCVDPENGELVKADFARQLERELTAVTEQRDRLAKAAQAVVSRWETPNWKNASATAEYIYRLRDALFESNHEKS
jgi:hypothetical protein